MKAKINASRKARNAMDDQNEKYDRICHLT